MNVLPFLLNRLLPKRERRAIIPELWIALYGPDGAGKSAVGARLSDQLAPLFSRVELEHLRIPLGRSPKQNVPMTQPHSQPSRGVLLSYLKLLYMFGHGWLAHLLLTPFRVASGQLVIFDRYFLDYAVDPRRYRLAATSIGLASLLGRFSPRPDLQFVLDVPAEELQKRKHEVSLAESERQRQEYAQQIGHLPNSVMVDADRPVAEVASEIVAIVAELLQRRSEAEVKADLSIIQ